MHQRKGECGGCAVSTTMIAANDTRALPMWWRCEDGCLRACPKQPEPGLELCSLKNAADYKSNPRPAHRRHSAAPIAVLE